MLDTQAELPYDRPPLSKQVMRGERELPVLLDDGALGSLAVDWRPGRTASRLDAERRVVVLDDREDLAYGVLIIATGARARRLPGLHGQVLRTFEDAVAIRDQGRPGRNVLVVGAGVVGCEVAASLRGLGATVHMVDPLPGPMVRVLGPSLAHEVTELHRDHGVVLHMGTVVESNRSGEVVLSDGTELHPDLVLESVGAEPELDWLEGSGLAIAGGVPCDAQQRTNLDDVYVVGDVAAPGGKRSEHWTAATHHADRAVAAILGSAPPAAEPPYWWSDQYDVKFQGVGEVDDADEVVVGRAEEGLIGLFGRSGRVVGVVGMGAPAQVMRLRDSVIEQASLVVASAELADASWHWSRGTESTGPRGHGYPRSRASASNQRST